MTDCISLPLAAFWHDDSPMFGNRGWPPRSHGRRDPGHCGRGRFRPATRVRRSCTVVRHFKSKGAGFAMLRRTSIVDRELIMALSVLPILALFASSLQAAFLPPDFTARIQGQ